MTSPRLRPEIYVTWLSKFIVGDSSCEWSAWFKSRHFYKKVPGDFASVEYKLKHTELLNQARSMLEAQGEVTSIECQNWFEIKGRAATLRGKPDLIALGAVPIVVDAKTGRERSSDIAQEMIYMWALPYAFPKYRGIAFDGLLVYTDHVISIPSYSITDEFKDTLLQLIERIGSSTAARKAPSYAECRFCDISKVDCVDRVEKDGQEGSVMTDLF
jgi:hypothetical protein